MKNKVPDTKVAPLSRKQRYRKAGHMGKERELLEQLAILDLQAKEKYDELDVIFQKRTEIKAKIEEQIQKQVIEQ